MSATITVLYAMALLPYAAFFGMAVFLFIAPCYDRLSGRAFVELFQQLDHFMRVRAPLLCLAQFALTLLVLGLTHDQWARPSFWLSAGALLMGLTSMAIAIGGNVPLNRLMDRWSPADPPPGWEQVRRRWLRYHHLRGLAETVGFLLLLAAAMTHDPARGAAERPAEEPAGGDARPAARRWEATAYLPLADNQGRPYSDATWEDALAALVFPFGGATLGQPQEGCWVDASGRACREPVRPVVVSFAPQRLGEYRRAIREVGHRLGQEAMYVRFERPRVEVVPVRVPVPTKGR